MTSVTAIAVAWKMESCRSSIVDLYISYLRKKIDTGHSPVIHTVRGVGYMLRSGE
jgi:two-component system, OmpR family, response regulator TrcR